MNWKLSGHQVLLLKLNRVLGWGIGILLSIIPKRLCFIFHQTGEIKAANDYIKLKSFIDQHNNFESFSSAKVKTILDKIIENENLLTNTVEMGDYTLDQLKHLQEKHKVIGKVRGKGLFLGAELVKDRESREPMDEKLVQSKSRVREADLVPDDGLCDRKQNVGDDQQDQ